MVSANGAAVAAISWTAVGGPAAKPEQAQLAGAPPAGTVLAETVAANKGIGNVMMIASGNFDVPLVFAGLVILAVMGVILYGVSSFIEGRMTGWAQRKSDVVMA